MAKHLSQLNGEFLSMVIVKHGTIYINDRNCKRKCKDLISRTMTLWKDVMHLTALFYASCNMKHKHETNLTKNDEQIQELWRRTPSCLNNGDVPMKKEQYKLCFLHSFLMN